MEMWMHDWLEESNMNKIWYLMQWGYISGESSGYFFTDGNVFAKILQIKGICKLTQKIL